MRVEFFIDPASGWTYLRSPLLAETEPRADEDHTATPQPPGGQGLDDCFRMGLWVLSGDK